MIPLHVAGRGVGTRRNHHYVLGKSLGKSSKMVIPPHGGGEGGGVTCGNHVFANKASHGDSSACGGGEGGGAQVGIAILPCADAGMC